MRSFGIGIATAVMIGLSTPASAQSLEETYANLCSDDSMKQGESCLALRKALLEKLSAESGSSVDPEMARTISPVGMSTAVPNSPGGPAGYRPTSDDIAAWGYLGDLAAFGGWYVRANETKGGSFTLYELAGPHKITQSMWLLPDGNLVSRLTYSMDALTGLVSAKMEHPEYKEIPGSGPVQQWSSLGGDKGFESEGEAQGDRWKSRSTFRPGKFVHEGYKWEDGRWVEAYKPIVQLAGPKSLDEARQYLEEELQAEQRAQQQAAAARKASNGGLLRSVIGAGVGLMAGAAHGLDSSQTVGAVMKGMQITNPNSPVVNALGGMGEQLLADGNTGMPASAGGVVSGASSYPTQANLAGGACSGFTEGNYRQMAVQGGGDSQLYTMCGQAFEYYTMYKRAIAQGASQADANRTYEAHRQAAATASGYLSSHGAN